MHDAAGEPVRAPVIVVGSVNHDLQFTVQHLPRPGQTVRGVNQPTSIGGKGANQAVAAARLGAEVRLIARLGTDGEATLDALRAQGIDTSSCVLDSDLATGMAIVVVDAEGENTIILSPGGNGALSEADLPASLGDSVAPAPVLLVQQEIPAEVVAATIRRGHDAGATVILNPAPFRPVEPSQLGQVDVLVPNAGELGELLGAREPRTAAEAADLLRGADLPCRAVIVTLGGNGALIAVGGHFVTVAAPTVDTVDTVGAGDTFCGALAEALARGDTLIDGARWAVHAAALAVTARGAQAAMPRADAVRELMARSAAPTGRLRNG